MSKHTTNRHHAAAMPGTLAAILCTGPALAQGEAEIPQLETVTVTAPGVRTSTVTTVDRQQIEDQHSAVAYDVLETRPGLHVVRRLGLTGSGLSRLTIRGNGAAGPAGLQVFVDGRPDATVSFAHPTPSAHSLADAERIEVIHGPSPVLHGSGKTGVVEITTGAPAPGLHGEAELSYGSFETTENYARLAYGGERGYTRASAAYRETEGDNPDSAAEIRSFNLKSGWRFDRTWDASFTAGVNEDSFEVFGSFFVPGPFTDPRTESLDLTQTVYDLTVTGSFSNVVTSLKLFHDELKPTSQILDGTEERAEVTEQGARFKTVWVASPDATLIAGIDTLQAEASNSPVLPPFGGPGLATPRDQLDESLTETGVYALLDHTLSRAFTFVGGARFTDHSEYGAEESGELGVLWRPATENPHGSLHGATFRVRATRGFQSPTLQQLFGVFRGGENGPANPELKAEIVEQLEIGFNRPFSNGAFDIVVYEQRGKGLIEAPASPPPPPPDIENDIDYTNQGIEATLHYLPSPAWETMLGITVADFEDRFVRAPQQTLDLGVTWRQPGYSLSLLGRYGADTYDVPAGATEREKLDDYFVADLKLNYRFNDNARAFFEIDNLTDEDYELVADIPAPSIGYFAGVNLRF